jgi:asparagine synthetase B (glutamine-hydrolysing)
MTLTDSLIDQLRFPGRMNIDAELENRLFEEFGTEPHPYEYSEQDLYEQVRKFIMHYNQEKEAVSPVF